MNKDIHEVSHWNMPLLTAEIKNGWQISEKSVSRFFNEVNLKPHKIRYWLHSTEKGEDQEAAAKKINEACTICGTSVRYIRLNGHMRENWQSDLVHIITNQTQCFLLAY